MSQEPAEAEEKNKDFELLQNYLENYTSITHLTSHCLGGEHREITGNMHGYHIMLSRGEVWNKITLSLYMTSDPIPTCIFTVKNLHGQACAMDRLLEVYKPKKEDDWKTVLINRIRKKLALIDKGQEIVFSYDFHRIVEAEIPEDLEDYQVLTLNFQSEKDDNPLPHANEEKNIGKVYVFSKVPNLKTKSHL